MVLPDGRIQEATSGLPQKNQATCQHLDGMKSHLGPYPWPNFLSYVHALVICPGFEFNTKNVVFSSVLSHPRKGFAKFGACGTWSWHADEACIRLYGFAPELGFPTQNLTFSQWPEDVLWLRIFCKVSRTKL